MPLTEVVEAIADGFEEGTAVLASAIQLDQRRPAEGAAREATTITPMPRFTIWR